MPRNQCDSAQAKLQESLQEHFGQKLTAWRKDVYVNADVKREVLASESHRIVGGHKNFLSFQALATYLSGRSVLSLARFSMHHGQSNAAQVIIGESVEVAS